MEHKSFCLLDFFVLIFGLFCFLTMFSSPISVGGVEFSGKELVFGISVMGINVTGFNIIAFIVYFFPLIGGALAFIAGVTYCRELNWLASIVFFASSVCALLLPPLWCYGGHRESIEILLAVEYDVSITYVLTTYLLNVEGLVFCTASGAIKCRYRKDMGLKDGKKSIAKSVVATIFSAGLYTYSWTHRVTKYLNFADEEKYDPTFKTTLCFLIPFYHSYLFYKNVQKLEKLCKQNNVEIPPLLNLCTIVSLFAPPLALAILQDNINKLCYGVEVSESLLSASQQAEGQDVVAEAEA